MSSFKHLWEDQQSDIIKIFLYVCFNANNQHLRLTIWNCIKVHCLCFPTDVSKYRMRWVCSAFIIFLREKLLWFASTTNSSHVIFGASQHFICTSSRMKLLESTAVVSSMLSSSLNYFTLVCSLEHVWIHMRIFWKGNFHLSNRLSFLISQSIQKLLVLHRQWSCLLFCSFVVQIDEMNVRTSPHLWKNYKVSFSDMQMSFIWMSDGVFNFQSKLSWSVQLGTCFIKFRLRIVK